MPLSMRQSLLLLGLTLLSCSSTANVCTSICEYNFEIRRTRTMIYKSGSKTFNVEADGPNLKVVSNPFRINEPLIKSYVDPEKVITGDGFVREIITINGEFPGPTIEVTEGAQIVVTVTNEMLLEGTSIHWHGMWQKKTPWFDGVGHITQCPIQPKNSFTYRFKAEPVGTHWYHAHFVNQRLDGLYGMLIVHPKVLVTMETLPLIVTDWWHLDANSVELTNSQRIDPNLRGTGELQIDIHDRDYYVDGTQLVSMNYQAGLINGRGRYGDNLLPLTKYEVSKGHTYRWRVVNAASDFGFQISVDNHQLTVVASDGGDIKPIAATYVIVHSGETMDIEMTADQSIDTYWVRARTLKAGMGEDLKPGTINEVNAVLIYSGNINATLDPTTSDHQCTSESPCIVFNCPFSHYPIDHNKTCLNIAEARGTDEEQAKNRALYGLDVAEESVEEFFFNYGWGAGFGASINARRFLFPSVPLYQDNAENYITKCEEPCENGCHCTHIKDLPFNKTVQFVITNWAPDDMKLYPGHHPAHLHGHSFAVLYMGHAETNQTSGLYTKVNNETLCEDALCAFPSWNPSAFKPKLNTENPPIKDTVIIPQRGYVVVRFRTENPGNWFFHCHYESHLLEGMGMVFREGPGLYPPPPEGFPRCGSFEFSKKDFEKSQNYEPGMKDTDVTDDTDPSNCTYIEDGQILLGIPVVVGAAIGIAFGGALIAVLIVLICLKK